MKLNRMIEIEFPVKYYESNIVFSVHEQNKWAYYEINGNEYDYKSEDDKTQQFARLESCFAQMGVDMHLLALPRFHSIREIHDRFKEGITGPLKQQAITHTEESCKVIEQFIGTQASDVHFFIGVKLPKPDKESMKNELKKLLNDFLSFTKAENDDIPEEEIKRVQRLEIQYYDAINRYFKAKRCTEEDIQYLIKHNFHRSIDKTPIIQEYKPQFDQTPKGRKPRYYDLLRLAEGVLDNEKNPRQITLNQVVNGEQRESYMAFLTLSFIPDSLFSLGDEWIYASQLLGFPVEISIRTKTIGYRDVMNTIVQRKKKELNDQETHAIKSKNEIPIQVAENADLVRDLEASTNTSKQPLLQVYTTFCVSAKTQDELKGRIRSLKDLYSDFKMQLEQPFTDQFLLFNEFLPGAEPYVKDYVQYMEPGVVAGGMFGATKQIGDSEGFYLGRHGVLNQSVYINPKSHALGLKGSKSSSPSIVFLGPPGGGKSFTANLITYLSVLGGAKALVIDPKNERGGWAQDLIDIGHEVNIITLDSTDDNKGRLDPFNVCLDLKQAEALAIENITFLVGIHPQDPKFPKITKAVQQVAAGEKPCLDKVVETLLKSEDKQTRDIGEHLESFQSLSFAKLLFGNGDVKNPISMDKALNVLQIANMKLPARSKPIERYSMNELLSMAMIITIGEYSHTFLQLDNSMFKIVFFDESWFMEQTEVGRDIIDRLTREGRHYKAGIYRSTQHVFDVDKETTSSIGMKFVFRNNDVEEIKRSLRFLGLEETKWNIETIQNLEIGECLMQDIQGRVAKVKIEYLFDDLFKAFDTRPPEQAAEEVEESEEFMEKELVNI